MSTPDERTTHEAPVGFVELFYDLVFVAATMVLSNEFAHDPSWHLAGTCSLMFVLIWLLWFHTTVLMNVDRRDDGITRALVFAQMFVILVVTLLFVQKDSTVDLVGAGYLVAVLISAVAHHRARTIAAPIGPWAMVRRNRLLASGVIMMVGLLTPSSIDWIPYAVAISLLIVPTSLSNPRGRAIPAIDAHHLAERAALLTLIVMGESFLKSALVLSTGSIQFLDLVALAVMFVILGGLFSIYFDDVPEAGIRPGVLGGEMWLLSHLVMQLSIVALAVGVSKFLQLGDTTPSSKGVLILMVAYVGIFVGLGLIGEFDMRVPRGAMLGLRLATAAIALGAGILTLVVDLLTPGQFLLVLAALSIGNAILGWRLRLGTVVVPPTNPSRPNQDLEVAS